MNTLGMNEVPYDAIFEIGTAIKAANHIAAMAKAGRKILILLFGKECCWEIRDKFLALGCDTYIAKDGIEIGAPDPTI